MDPATRPKLVTTVHGTYSVNAYSAVMTKGERVIAVSNTIREYILSNYPKVDPEKIRLIYRGVDPHEFPRGYQPSEEWLAKWRQDYPQSVGKIIITLPGRITRLKGQLDFVQLIARLKYAGLNVHGLIVGEPAQKKQAFLHELVREINQSNLIKDISLTGHRSDLKEIMAISNIVLSLSRYVESFGRTVLEALSLGTPVIGYNHGGVSEILTNIFPAGCVRVGDVAALEASCLNCLSQKQNISENKNFTLASMLSNTLAEYQSLMLLKDEEHS
jgi:glycosyltransferase involved in cell wall biosynthesis